MILRAQRKLFFTLLALSWGSVFVGSLFARWGTPNFLVVLCEALFVAVVGTVVAMRNVMPLKEAASKITAGDLNARARIEVGHELAEVGTALDQLAQNLSSTTKQLKAERNRLETVLSGMTEGVLLLDREGHIALANRALRSMSLLTGEVEGKSPIEVIRNAELTELLERARESGESVSGEVELYTPVARRVLVRTRPLAGRDAGFVAVFVDVTDLRRLENVRKEFVTNASHELRTPIASVHSAAETLLAGAAEQPEARQRFLEIILRNSSRLRQLVDDMLDLSRLEARGFRIAAKEVNPSPVVNQAILLLAEEASRKNIKLVCDLPPQLRVLADPSALEHVVLNLIDNAIKYCPSGSEVRVDQELTGKIVKLRIRDNGPGIESKHLPRLFERFYRVDPGRSRDLGGTGLGLAIVKHLVEAMKGQVSVESEVGRGTTFSVHLPLV